MSANIAKTDRFCQSRTSLCIAHTTLCSTCKHGL